MTKQLVGIVHGTNVEDMVRESISLIGDLDSVNVKGKRVLVKPNVVTANPSPVTTNPQVVRAVVKLMYEGGASEVVVGDSSAFIALPTRDNMRRTGVEAAARETGAEVAYFEEEDWVRIRPTNTKYIKEFQVSKRAYEADVLVSVPVIKTHRYATYTIALKNTLGIIHPQDRPSVHGSGNWEEVVAEINVAVQPSLIIVDGTKSMVAGGPLSGIAAETNMILATKDLIAADVIGLGVIKSFGKWDRVSERPVWDQKQVRRAVELGLGVGKGDELEIRAKELAPDAEGFTEMMNKVAGYLKP